MQGTTRAESSARTRATILDAALAAFSDGPVDKVTIDDIRQRAEVSVGTIYHHFANREQIIDALHLQAVDEWQDAFLTALRRSRNPRRGIEHAVEAHLSFITTQPALASILLSRAEPEDPVIRQHLSSSYTAFGTGFGDWLAPHADAGLIRRLPPEMYAAIIIGPCMELSRHVIAGRTTQPITKARAQLAELIWAAIRTAA